MKSIDWKKNPFIIIGGLCRDSDKHQESLPLYFSHFHPHSCLVCTTTSPTQGQGPPDPAFGSSPLHQDPLQSLFLGDLKIHQDRGITLRSSVIIQELDSMVLVRIFHNPMIIHQTSLFYFTTVTLNTKIFREFCLFLLLLFWFFST